MADGPLLGPGVDLGQQAGVMSSDGVGAIRVAFYWDVAQPQAGVAPDFTSTDAVVAAAAAHGIDVLPVVVRAPAWARKDAGDDGSPPRSNAAYGAFLTALVQRYGPNGLFWAARPDLPARPIRRWQVWNEPDISKYFAPAKSQSAWAAPYVTMAKAARAALKAADPGSTVVCAGLTNESWVDLAKLYRAGIRGTCDEMAIHPFSRSVSNVLKIVGLARREMTRAHDGARKLLLTEISWSSGKGRSTFNYGWETTEQGQAERIRQVLPRLAAKRVAYRLAGVFWFTWMSVPLGGKDSFDYSGLTRFDAPGRITSKPALFAWRDTVARLTR